MMAVTETLMNLALLIEKNEMEPDEIEEFLDDTIEALEEIRGTIDEDEELTTKAVVDFIREHAKDLEP